jgi:hypothetical protein
MLEDGVGVGNKDVTIACLKENCRRGREFAPRRQSTLAPERRERRERAGSYFVTPAWTTADRSSGNRWSEGLEKNLESRISNLEF